MRQHEQWQQSIFCLLLLAFLSLLIFDAASADPNGAIVSSASTESRNTTPGSRQDDRSTITTMILQAIQPSPHWKAYVGNVSGSLTLDDAANFTIYDWDLASITGEVYASRYDNISWYLVGCAAQGLIINESVFHNMTDSDVDDINSTFNWSIHQQFVIANNTITANTCNSTVTYQNDTRQTPTASSRFQEILVQDANGYLIYATSLNDDTQGFDNQTYDFQLIVAESDVKASPTTYYFWVELGG